MPISSPSLSPPLHKAYYMCRDSSVGIATPYSLPVGARFSYQSRPALVSPPQPPIELVLGPLQGYSCRNVALTTHSHLAPRLKEELELYIYSPPGPSCSVLGWTLPLPVFLRKGVFLKLSASSSRLCAVCCKEGLLFMYVADVKKVKPSHYRPGVTQRVPGI